MSKKVLDSVDDVKVGGEEPKDEEPKEPEAPEEPKAKEKPCPKKKPPEPAPHLPVGCTHD